MKRNTVYAVIGIITVSLFTMSLLVSAQPWGGNGGRFQMGRQGRGHRWMGQQEMTPEMNWEDMEQQGMWPGRNRGLMRRQGMGYGRNRGAMRRQGMGFGQNQGRQRMWLIWQDMGLSEEQQSQLWQIQRDFQVNTAAMRAELRYTQQDLRLEIAQDTPDQANIDSLLNEIAGLNEQFSEAETQHFLAIKAILTPEQVEQFAARRQPIPRQLEALELPDAQRTKIGAVVEESRDKRRELREELRELRDEFHDLLLTSGETDSAKLQQVRSNIAAKDVELEKERVNGFLQMKALLTPEQQEQLREAPFARRMNRGMRRGFRGPRGSWKFQ